MQPVLGSTTIFRAAFSSVVPVTLRSLVKGLLPGTTLTTYVAHGWDVTRFDQEMEGAGRGVFGEDLGGQDDAARIQYRNVERGRRHLYIILLFPLRAHA